MLMFHQFNPDLRERNRRGWRTGNRSRSLRTQSPTFKCAKPGILKVPCSTLQEVVVHSSGESSPDHWSKKEKEKKKNPCRTWGILPSIWSHLWQHPVYWLLRYHCTLWRAEVACRSVCLCTQSLKSQTFRIITHMITNRLIVSSILLQKKCLCKFT